MVLFWNLPINSQKKFQPSKSTIVEVTAGLEKTTMNDNCELMMLDSLFGNITYIINIVSNSQRWVKFFLGVQGKIPE